MMITINYHGENFSNYNFASLYSNIFNDLEVAKKLYHQLDDESFNLWDTFNFFYLTFLL